MNALNCLKKQSVRDVGVAGVILAAIAAAVCLLFGGQNLIKTLSPKTFAELSPETMEGQYVEDDVYFLYTPYLETEKYKNSRPTGEITGVQYVIDLDGYYYMGLSAHKSDLDRTEELMNACDEYYEGKLAPEDIPVLHVKGTIKSMDSDEKRYYHEMAGGSQEVLDAMLPYYLDMGYAGKYPLFMVYLIDAVSAVLIAIALYRLMKALTGGYQKDLKKKLEAMGDPAVMEEKLNRFYEGSDPVNGVRLGEEFVLFQVGADSMLFRPWDILWVYQNTTQHRTNGIPTGKTHSAVLCTAEGKRISLSMSDKKVKELLAAIEQKLPGTILGYSKELDKLYEQNRGAFLAKWEEARPGCTRQGQQSQENSSAE